MSSFMKSIGRYFAAHWYERLSSCFIAIIMVSVLAIFEGYWWKESFIIAYCTIAMSAVIDLALSWRAYMIKLVLKLAAALVITIRFARMEWLGVWPKGWSDRYLWLETHSVQLHPFIWISLALLLIHLLFAGWTTTRTRMFGFIGVSLLILTIMDSFSPSA